MTVLYKPILSAAVIATLLSAVPIAQAAPEKYTLDTAHTFPVFEINHLGWSNTRGLFRKTTGAVTLDFAAKTGTADIQIDANSIDTFDTKRDEHLRGDKFFDVAKYPTITFAGKKLTFDGQKLVKADGQLTLRGVTKPVVLQFHLFKCGEHPIYKKPYCGGDASTTIKRSDFGMTAYPGAVGEEVKLMIQIEAVREEAAKAQ